ncbi:DUF5665 domain-containing protein [Paenibacillus sp. y28]|uniref:DUF5665 domain-containing protein n=1 Tax=Paenibacillus sp. y28 TaxID=3129110 RepID=UPI003017B305
MKQDEEQSGRPPREDALQHPSEWTKQDQLTNMMADLIDRTELLDILETYASPRRRLFINFTAGLARGLGMTIGTAILLALFGWVTSKFVSLPFIGERLASLVEYIEHYRYNK